MSQSPDKPYRGRFAPSPTGPLHFGSLLAAMGSYLQAQKHQGKWLVRIEDIDAPRTVKGASDNILRTLEHYGFEWDEEIAYQSQRTEAYEETIQQLQAKGLTYACTCSRKQIAEHALVGVTGAIYPGTCRTSKIPKNKPAAIRLQTPDDIISFSDPIQGTLKQNIAKDTGDFVVKRADGYFTYQLAVVIDDFWQNITEVVRGSDFFVLTPRQLLLQSYLDFPQLSYIHLPVASNLNGEKLSKQTGATALPEKQPSKALCKAIAFYGHTPPADLYHASVNDFWQWASENWQLQRVPKALSISLDTNND